MKLDEVMNNIKNINDGSAGCSLRIQIAAYNLLDYVIETDNYKKLIKSIYNYYKNDYEFDESLTTSTDELEYLLSLCCTLLLNGKNYYLKDAGLNSKNYTNIDIIKFIKFVDLINEKYNYELNLDSVNDLRLHQISSLQEKTEKSLNNVNDKIKNVSKRIDKIHFDTISIVSIFVAIIFALYGSIQLVNSVITKIDKSNCELIIKTGIIMGYILVVLTSLLLSSLISYSKNNIKGWILVILNVMYSIVVIVSLYIRC